VPNGKLLHNLKPFSPGITSVRFSPDGIILAASDFQDRSVKLWNVQDGKLVHVIAGNLTCAEFSPDGATLVTGDETGSLKFWGRMIVTREAFEVSQKRKSMPGGATPAGRTAGPRPAPAGAASSLPHRAPAPNVPGAASPAKPNGPMRPNPAAHPKAEGPRQRIEPLQQPAGTRAGAQPQTATKTVQEKFGTSTNIDGNPYELELERLLEKQKRQAEKLEKMGRCLECGKKLGVFAKMWGLKFCKEHGF
ncbi:MAG: hypothetical protein ACRENG_37025, partial [bacterium]